LPPRCYWKLDNRTGPGRQGAEDWFAGFRLGTDAAIESGLRNVDTVPTSVLPRGAPPGMVASPGTATLEAPVLPEPREVSPAQPAPETPVDSQ
jgi:hypothetical protein